MSDAHEAWVDRCTRWERLYREERNKLGSMERLYQAAEADLEADVAERDTQIAALKAALLPRDVLERLDQKFDGDCYLDHDGFCQQHTFGDPCVMPVIRAALAAAVGIPEEPRDA